MAEGGGRVRVVVAPAAWSDIGEALAWSRERFGARAAERYRDLIKRALRDVAADPEMQGYTEQRELAHSLSGIVNRPQYFVVYRRPGAGIIDVLQATSDSMALDGHWPEEHLRNEER